MQQWIEIKIVLSIAAWVIGGSLVIHATNAIAHIATPVDFIVADIDRGSLRLKSLRLVGQVVN
jgi:hypothetical protein